MVRRLHEESQLAEAEYSERLKELQREMERKEEEKRTLAMEKEQRESALQ
jgi:hypothetical protein